MNVTIHGVSLTHPDKVLYPKQGITKLALADYYEVVADWMLPHIRMRPISLVRCPMGRARNCFFQRHAGSGVPPQIREIKITGFEESGAYLYLTGMPGISIPAKVWRSRTLFAPRKMSGGFSPRSG